MFSSAHHNSRRILHQTSAKHKLPVQTSGIFLSLQRMEKTCPALSSCTQKELMAVGPKGLWKDSSTSIPAEGSNSQILPSTHTLPQPQGKLRQHRWASRAISPPAAKAEGSASPAPPASLSQGCDQPKSQLLWAQILQRVKGENKRKYAVKNKPFSALQSCHCTAPKWGLSHLSLHYFSSPVHLSFPCPLHIKEILAHSEILPHLIPKFKRSLKSLRFH